MSERKAKNRRWFSPEFKLRAASRLVAGECTLAELSRELGVKDSVLAAWRDQFLERASAVFGTSAPSQEARIAELEREIGRLHLENEILKKASKRLL